jgi:ParB family transcriptional regulator, chromosome partitioning protein
MMDEKKKEKPKHLGRGLESLLGPITNNELETQQVTQQPVYLSNFPIDKKLSASYQEIPLEKITANPYQARTIWNDQELAELADSIKVNGVVQPIIVRAYLEGYQIIAGERRFRAAKLASFTTIPALIRQASDEQLHEWSLVENIHRVGLNPIERAKAYREYINTFSLSQVQAAERLGEDRSVIANYLRLLDLPQEIRQMLIDDQLSMGHARAILALPSDELRRKLANRAMAGRLSVREVERLVRSYIEENPQAGKKIKQKTPHILDIENKLSSQLGTKVSIDARKNGKKGKIIIEFYSLDEFDSIIERLGLACIDEI